MMRYIHRTLVFWRQWRQDVNRRATGLVTDSTIQAAVKRQRAERMAANAKGWKAPTYTPLIHFIRFGERQDEMLTFKKQA